MNLNKYGQLHVLFVIIFILNDLNFISICHSNNLFLFYKLKRVLIKPEIIIFFHFIHMEFECIIFRINNYFNWLTVFRNIFCTLFIFKSY